jgi:hypothetical protein
VPFPEFDRRRLRLRPLAERDDDMHLEDVLSLDSSLPDFAHPGLDAVAERIVAAREKGAAVILMLGAHVIKTGMSRFLIELMRHGYVSHFALNVAGITRRTIPGGMRHDCQRCLPRSTQAQADGHGSDARYRHLPGRSRSSGRSHHRAREGVPSGPEARRGGRYHGKPRPAYGLNPRQGLAPP